MTPHVKGLVAGLARSGLGVDDIMVKLQIPAAFRETVKQIVWAVANNRDNGRANVENG